MSETTFATALDSLGTLLEADPGRDAIHLATHAVTAAEKLFPGQHIGLTSKGASAKADKLLGIVDPFLPGVVHEGQMFWLVLYPRTITSLRHVWEHPDFSPRVILPVADTSPVVDPLDRKAVSKAYLEDFAKRLFSYYGKEDDEYPSEYKEGFGEHGSRLEVLISGIEYGGSFGTDIEYEDGLQPSDELYRHYEIYTGKPAPVRPEYFRCAC